MHRPALFAFPIALLAAMTFACATHGSASSEQREIMTMLGEWKKAMAAEDVSRAMAFYSENFNTDGRDKAAEAKWLKAEFEDGLVRDAIITVENATVTAEGNTATVLPITFSKPTGSGTIRLALAKENGRWLITGMSQ